MTTIFDEIRPRDNLNFGELNGTDLSYLLGLINKFDLVLRERIYVPETETIGLELECDDADWDQIRKGKLSDWELVPEGSIENGAELKSSVLRDTKESWIDLRNMCDLVSRSSKISEKCGAHVHTSNHALGMRKKILFNFLKLWAIYEPIMLRFGYGEFLGPRPGLNEFAKSVRSEFADLCSYTEIGIEELLHHLSSKKRQVVNFRHYNTLRTIEFRGPNGTLNPVIWQNNANVFMKMVLYSGSGRFASGLIDERIERLFLTRLSDSEVHTDYAIEFADLVFDNNLDKIYFLRQYLKDFEKGGQYVKAKPFTQTL